MPPISPIALIMSLIIIASINIKHDIITHSTMQSMYCGGPYRQTEITP